MAVIICRNAYFSSYFDDVVKSINNSEITSAITNTDMPAIKKDLSTVQADNNANNLDQLKNDIKTLDTDLAAANEDASSAIKTANEMSLQSKIRSDMDQFKSVFETCILNASK